MAKTSFCCIVLFWKMRFIAWRLRAGMVVTRQ